MNKSSDEISQSKNLSRITRSKSMAYTERRGTFRRRIAMSACESSIDWLPHSVHRTLWLIFLARASTTLSCLTSSSFSMNLFLKLVFNQDFRELLYDIKNREQKYLAEPKATNISDYVQMSFLN